VRIACVGGGPAGLYFSLLAKRRDPGGDVTVFERSKANVTYGWGVTYGQSLLERLYDNDPESAREIERASLRWRDQVIHFRGERLVFAGGDAYNINRQRLLDILAVRAVGLGVNIHYDHEVPSAAQLGQADLIIAADGVNSRIRTESGTFHSDIRLGCNKYIWLGTDKVFESFTFIFVQTDSGWVWAHAYGVDSSSSTFVVECSGQTWAGLGFDTMSHHQALAVLERLFQDYLDGHQLVGQVSDGTPAQWLNFRNVSNRCWHDGKIVLAGDSAHTTHFTVGLGTTLAIEDVIVLADSLLRHGDTESALRSYETQRQAQLERVLGEAGCSGQWFENVDRYASLKPNQFSVLLHARRSPLVRMLPPLLCYQLHQATESITALRELRSRMGPVAKVIYGRRRRAKGEQDEATTRAVVRKLQISSGPGAR
jgi:2-polyprenyl-6-methoxyphenol hydroxylase-like FAD-dependent oxidoreductase